MAIGPSARKREEKPEKPARETDPIYWALTLLEVASNATRQASDSWVALSEASALGGGLCDWARRVLDWLASDPERVTVAGAAGLFDLGVSLSLDQRREADIAGEIIRHWRAGEPSMRSRGYHRYMGVNETDCGVDSGMDHVGKRYIDQTSHGRLRAG